jgi:soluble lytic murein transglycosylase-like protein
LGDARRIASRPHPASGEIARLVRSLAPRYRLDPNLVLAVVEVESNFNPTARSHKNAQGLMQLIPATAERFGVRDVWDPEQNLRGGMAYLRWLLDHFDGDVKLALAGYNAGEKAVERHGGVPPYKETQAYVRRILRRLGADEASDTG